MPTDPSTLMAALRARLEQDAADGKLAGITVDDLMDAMSHPKAGAVIARTNENRSAVGAAPDRPRRPRRV